MNELQEQGSPGGVCVGAGGQGQSPVRAGCLLKPLQLLSALACRVTFDVTADRKAVWAVRESWTGNWGRSKPETKALPSVSYVISGPTFLLWASAFLYNIMGLDQTFLGTPFGLNVL